MHISSLLTVLEPLTTVDGQAVFVVVRAWLCVTQLLHAPPLLLKLITFRSGEIALISRSSHEVSSPTSLLSTKAASSLTPTSVTSLGESSLAT